MTTSRSRPPSSPSHPTTPCPTSSNPYYTYLTSLPSPKFPSPSPRPTAQPPLPLPRPSPLLQLLLQPLSRHRRSPPTYHPTPLPTYIHTCPPSLPFQPPYKPQHRLQHTALYYIQPDHATYAEAHAVVGLVGCMHSCICCLGGGGGGRRNRRRLR